MIVCASLYANVKEQEKEITNLREIIQECLDIFRAFEWAENYITEYYLSVSALAEFKSFFNGLGGSPDKDKVLLRAQQALYGIPDSEGERHGA